ncbi:hypothetical protein [Methylobacterium indicum]|uniref:Conjugal transfer protein TraG n=1 Tax=Methylobacterium indicum TaxID=1775910 RepID=A0ABR5HIP8_9HYPH|nr:hypothetical protein [Methylobacterium indicum]KMO22438.1 hypothetical protein QR78_07095 [Methylobacterium indicum]KMO26545.1 hypothetical protein QR79_01940 [Methylobacterium indicum]
MKALRRTPVESISAGSILTLSFVACATMAVLSLVWWTFTPVLGQVYAALRLLETLTLWRFTGWGRYFTGMPAGQPFAFVSIYQSSAPFGLVAALLTALIGFLAWGKRSRNHIDALITLPRQGFTRKEIGRRFMPADRLVRLPDQDQDQEPLSSPPAKCPNRFVEVRDLMDARAVETVPDDVPWHLAGALVLTIDALAPLADRKLRERVLNAVRAAADRHAVNPLCEQPATLLPTLHGALVQAIADQKGRGIAELLQVHAVLETKEYLEEAVSTLASVALTERGLKFPDYAWLRHVDPRLQSEIRTY